MKADAKLSHTVLLVTHLTPFPPARGVELRIWKLLHWLKSEGYQVILVLPCDPMDAHAVAKLQQVVHRVCWSDVSLRTKLGKQFPALKKLVWEPLKPFVRRPENTVAAPAGERRTVGDANYKRALCPEAMIDLVTRLARKYQPKAVIAEYIFLAPAFQHLPEGTLKIIDTIDVFSQKPEQVLAYGIDDPQACTRDEERDYLLMADVIVAIQSREAKLLRQLVPEREVILAGIDFELDEIFSNDANNYTLAVVGADNIQNVHGLTGFLRNCWPQIKAACPEVTLHVVGKIGEKCLVEDRAIKYTRWVDDLSDVYASANVIINPVIAGTGLKVKSAETIAHGRPLVSWPNGVDGIDYIGKPPYVVCHSWDQFADRVVALLQSPEARQELAERASSYARHNFSRPSVYLQLKQILSQDRCARRP